MRTWENLDGSSHFLFGTITISFNSCQGNQQFETPNIETTSKASRAVRYLIHFWIFNRPREVRCRSLVREILVYDNPHFPMTLEEWGITTTLFCFALTTQQWSVIAISLSGFALISQQLQLQ